MKTMRAVKDYFIPHKDNDFRPHLFREEAMAVLLGALVLLFASSVGSTLLVQNKNLLGDVYASVLVDLANQDRTEANATTLAVNPLLTEAATEKGQDMSTKGYFAHTSPEGLTPWYWFQKVGYNFAFAGENLAVGFENSIDVNQGWLNSPGHRANILNANFTEIGIATYPGIYKGRQTVFVVQLFGKPKIASTNPPVAKPVPIVTATVPTTSGPTKVLAAEAEGNTTIAIIGEQDNLIVAQSADETSTPALTRAVETPAPHYTHWYEWLLINQPRLVENAFTITMAVLLIGLLFFIFVEFRIQHWKNLGYGVGLLAIVLVLTILNQSLIVVPVFIR